MTTVKIDLRKADGSPIAGYVSWTPTRRVHVDTSDVNTDYVLLPSAFIAPLVGGKATVEVLPSGPDWAWSVTEAYPFGKSRLVSVPNDPLPVAYGDLIEVDPASLDPVADPDPAWWAALQEIAARPVDPAAVAQTVEDVLPTLLSSGGSVFLVTSAPTTISGSKNQDLAINTVNGDLYRRESGTWVLKGSVKGPQGDPGEDGPQGLQGLQGVPGTPGDTLSIGTVATGAAGSSATATLTGTSPNKVLNLTIPRGNTGVAGTAGDTLSIGTVTTGAAGSAASATITGTSPTKVLNLVLPRGADGASGATLPDLTQALIVAGSDTTKSAVSAKVFKDSVAALTQPIVASVAANYTRCTSTTRPATPSPGDQIFETDTRAHGVYDSTLGWLMTDTVWQSAPLLASFGSGAFITWNSSQTLNKYMRAGKRLHVEFGFNIASDAVAGSSGSGRLHVSLPAGLQMASYQYSAPWGTYITLGMARARKVSTSADTPVHIAPAGAGFVDFVNPAVEWVDLSGWWGTGMYVMGTYILELA